MFDSDFLPGLEKALFCWRLCQQRSTKLYFKCLTIEDTDTPTVRTTTNGIHPLDLHGVKGYKDELKDTTKFNWRWKNRGLHKFRVVTLEDAQTESETQVRH